jgi:large subunit ribosomal protein L35
MPKLKTHRGAAKRFKVTGGGRIKRNNPGHRHLLTSKSRKRKRQQRLPEFIHSNDSQKMQRLLPYL